MLRAADSLGGDLYWAAGLSIISNIPSKAHWPVKTHVFVNAGRLNSHDRCSSILMLVCSTYIDISPVIHVARKLTENFVECLSKPSISAGVGLIYRFDPIRVELNFGVPLVASKSDSCRKGFQVGMGVEFL